MAKTPSERIDAILASADFFPLSGDFESQVLRFVQMSRDSYYTSAFLDDRLTVAKSGSANIEIDKIQRRYDDTSELRFNGHLIFHTAYCCSTLLARALDVPGETMVYREPDVLTQLAMSKRTGMRLWDSSKGQRALGLLLTLLGRSYDGELAIIKLSDSVNNLMHEFIGYSESTRALVMYAKLDSFVLSNLKSQRAETFC